MPAQLLQGREHFADRLLLPDRGALALDEDDGRGVSHQVEIVDQRQQPDIRARRARIVVPLPVGVGQPRPPSRASK